MCGQSDRVALMSVISLITKAILPLVRLAGRVILLSMVRALLYCGQFDNVVQCSRSL